MDVMEARRRLMASMSSKSVFDEMLEIIDSFTPTEKVYEHTFSWDETRGVFLLMKTPPGSYEDSLSNNDKSLIVTVFYYKGVPASVSGGYTLVYDAAKSNIEYVDNWTPSITMNGNQLTINPGGATRVAYVPGSTYYLIRNKLS